MSDDCDCTPAGPILDELGVTLAVKDQDRVTEVLVLAKVMNLEDGQAGLIIGSNDLDWIQIEGLVGAARQVMHRSEGL